MYFLFCTVPKKPCRKIWTIEEKQAVEASLGSYFHLSRLPGKAEIMRCQQQPVLKHRSWQNIKDYVRNTQLQRSKFVWSASFCHGVVLRLTRFYVLRKFVWSASFCHGVVLRLTRSRDN